MRHPQKSHAAAKLTLEALVLVVAVLFGGMTLAQTPVESGGQDKIPHTKPAIPASSADWPCWRGPGSVGVRSTALAATQWSEDKGILWKASVPGKGHASPIVFGDQVFVSTADDTAQIQALIALNCKTGALLWNTPFYRGRFPYKNQKNSHASATPICDGAHVFIPSVADSAVWLTAINLAGKVAWQSRLGPFASEWGYASSPVLYKDLVIVVGDNKGSPDAANPADTSYLVGVDRKTGATVWRVPRPLIPSYGTPVVAHLAGRDQLLISGAERIVAYDPADGKEIWSYRWGASRSANSMVFGADCVYASTTWRDNQILCVRADGTGDVTDSHLVWKLTRNVTDIPSPLYHDGRLYLTSDRGVAICMDGATGKTIWQNRLGGPISASPVLAGQAILSIDEFGKAHLFKAGIEFELLAENVLNDRVLASPALAGDHIFVRGMTHVYCVDGRTQSSPAVVNVPAMVNVQPSPAPSRPIDKSPITKVQPAKASAPAKAPVPAVPPQPDDDDIPWWFWLTAAIFGVITILASLVIAALLLTERRGDKTPPPAPAKARKSEAPPPTLIFIKCSGCAKNLKVKRQLAGKKVKCRQCGRIMQVPADLGVKTGGP